MEKDRQDAQWKKWKASLRLGDPRHNAKVAWPSAKGAAPPTMMPPPAAPASTTKSYSPPRGTKMAMSGIGGTGQVLSVDDDLVGGVTMFDA
jgi:hypothetical protein